MTSEERAQLVEDIKKNNHKRQQIIERAEGDEAFDIVAAWSTVEELEASIAERIANDRTSE